MGRTMHWGIFWFLATADLESSIRDISSLIQESWKAPVTAPEAQQTSLNSPAEVVLQNLRALDVLTAETGGACALLGEECSFYINSSEKVEDSLEVLKKK